jgi:hypothetical protein
MLLLQGAAQGGPREGRIQVAEVEVRSGPSMSYYPTSKLRRGDPVTIVDEKDGWLSIRPPNPVQDSFSWIEARAVQKQGQMFVVVLPEARIRVGSRIVNKPPTVEGPRLAQGTQLVVLGPAQTSSDGTWLPIAPAPSEVRYLPANAVENGSTVKQTPPPPVAPPIQGGFTQAGSGVAPAGNNSLLSQAELAEQAGRYSDALALYDQLARQSMTTNYDLAIKCLNRMQYLKDRQHSAAVPATAWQGSDVRQDGHMAVSPAAGSGYVTSGGAVQTAQAPTGNSDPAHTVRLVPPPATTPPPPGASGQWYEAGWLTYTTLATEDDHRPIYRYTPLSNHTWAYVTAGPNVGLEPFVNKKVILFGNMQYHRILRYWYLDVQQVALSGQ